MSNRKKIKQIDKFLKIHDEIFIKFKTTELAVSYEVLEFIRDNNLENSEDLKKIMIDHAEVCSCNCKCSENKEKCSNNKKCLGIKVPL